MGPQLRLDGAPLAWEGEGTADEGKGYWRELEVPAVGARSEGTVDLPDVVARTLRLELWSPPSSWSKAGR